VFGDEITRGGKKISNINNTVLWVFVDRGTRPRMLELKFIKIEDWYRYKKSDRRQKIMVRI